jgi:hypothetical protein
MADYSSEIAALKEAIGSGATRISYDNKSVEYGSRSDLLRVCAGWKNRTAPRRDRWRISDHSTEAMVDGCPAARSDQLA